MFLFIALAAAMATLTSAELFTSLDQMKAVFVVQHQIAQELRHFVEVEKARLDQVKQLVESLDQDSKVIENEQQLNDLISNPISVYKAIKMHQKDNFAIQSLLDNEKNMNESLVNMAPYLDILPTEEDYHGSIEAILRLQSTYDISTDQFVQGHIGLNKSRSFVNNALRSQSPFMTARDCFDIGQAAYNKRQYATALTWFDASHRILLSEQVPTVDKLALFEYLSYCNYLDNNIETALTQTYEMLRLDPKHRYAAENIEYYQYTIKQGQENPDGSNVGSQLVDEEISDFDKNFKKLCRGERTVEIQDEHKLFCDYARNGDPRLLIAPLRRETVNFDPWIVIYHNAIFDDEIEFFKSVALPKLNRATTFNKETGKLDYADYRITKTAWFENDTDDFYTPRILQRVSAMTQLTLEYVEPFQVANYGLGGHYSSHFDHSDDDGLARFSTEEGNRIATLLVYMTDVEAGGATIFNDLGLTIFPEKGAAVFWHNLQKSGKGDRRLRHAACPVLLGTKWVVNKWFHYGGNEFWHPCGLNESEGFSYSYMEDSVASYHRSFGRFQ